MRCKQTDRVPVITEWQAEVLCPDCEHYREGLCAPSSGRRRPDEPCPFDLVPVDRFTQPLPPERRVAVAAGSGT